MVDPIRIHSPLVNDPSGLPVRPDRGQTSCNTTFAQALADVQHVRFSNHAQKRLQIREIQLSQDNVERLSTAIDKAEKRGGKNSLVLVDDLAFIVNVQDRLVVTAMDKSSSGEGVFTQIDSVVIAE